MSEDQMVGWHYQLKGHEFEQTLGDGEGQVSLVCCRPWGQKESDMTEQLNNNTLCAKHTPQAIRRAHSKRQTDRTLGLTNINHYI